MKVLVTGATGFVGTWLVRELTAAGHEPIEMPGRAGLDIRDREGVRRFVGATRPDAAIHLAAVSFGPDARREPEQAMGINVEGTRNVLDAISGDARMPMIVVSSSDVYGPPDPGTLPLTERAQLRADSPYGRSKVALEALAQDAAVAGARLAIARPFNHTGPGQRLEFVVPALARRILDAQAAEASTIVAGNIDVRRDFSDVRDVARAYRRLLEWLAARPEPPVPTPIFNIATGHSTAIREIIERLTNEIGFAVDIATDPSLVRPDDPPDIRGDAAALRAAIGWTPEIPLATTLRDVVADVRARRAATPRERAITSSPGRRRPRAPAP